MINENAISIEKIDIGEGLVKMEAKLEIRCSGYISKEEMCSQCIDIEKHFENRLKDKIMENIYGEIRERIFEAEREIISFCLMSPMDNSMSFSAIDKMREFLSELEKMTHLNTVSSPANSPGDED